MHRHDEKGKFTAQHFIWTIKFGQWFFSLLSFLFDAAFNTHHSGKSPLVGMPNTRMPQTFVHLVITLICCRTPLQILFGHRPPHDNVTRSLLPSTTSNRLAHSLMLWKATSGRRKWQLNNKWKFSGKSTLMGASTLANRRITKSTWAHLRWSLPPDLVV